MANPNKKAQSLRLSAHKFKGKLLCEKKEEKERKKSKKYKVTLRTKRNGSGTRHIASKVVLFHDASLS